MSETVSSTMGQNKTAPVELGSHGVILVGLLLFLVALVVYYPAVRNQFVNYDDNFYVTANRMVEKGLTIQGIRGAFMSNVGGNWHPLTMLSLELDAQLFGKDPSGFHFTNLLLHALSTCLLFLVLKRMTGCVWKSAWVAALFALHPLHVESVAWVAERKDVLSGLFWMLTLLAYVWYTERPSWQRYTCVAVALALGLMAKVMLVTLPCVLLLLDYWPLGRFRKKGSPGLEPDQAAVSKDAGKPSWSLLVEKIPLFALSAIFSAIAVWTQQQAHTLHTFGDRPFALRLQNAVLGYSEYLYKMIWPIHLDPYYPLPANGWPAWQVAGALVLFAGVTALFLGARRRPFLLVGWCWYVVTLVPVIGLVPVGDQAWADRYTYLPLVGIFLLLAWGCAELWAAWRLPKAVLGSLAVAAIVLCAALTRIQIAYWHDDLALWQHTLDVDPENDVAHNNLANCLAERGKLNDAMEHWVKAVASSPRNDKAQVNLAKGLLLQKKRSEAEHSLAEALLVHAENEAAHLLLAGIQFADGRLEEAMGHLETALRVRSENAETHLLMGEIFAARGNWQAAARHFADVTRLLPASADGHHRLGIILGRLGRWTEAVTSLRQAVLLQPNKTSYRSDLALALYESGDTQKAHAEYAEASIQQPDWLERLQAFVWEVTSSKETNPDQENKALEAAKEICQATYFGNPYFLHTLAAAYAETRHYEEALQTAHRALQAARAGRQDALAVQIEERMKHYERRESPREAQRKGAGTDHGKE